MDKRHLILTRELKEVRKNEPVASRTLVGWVIHGTQNVPIKKSETEIGITFV